MAKRGHTEEETLRVLREAESGTAAVEICRKHGISQQSFYLRKKKYAGLGLSELRELRQLFRGPVVAPAPRGRISRAATPAHHASAGHLFRTEGKCLSCQNTAISCSISMAGKSHRKGPFVV